MTHEQLSFAEHIRALSQSYRVTLYNIKKIRFLLSEYAVQFLTQALVTND